MNLKFQNALQLKAQNQPPVWLMRQAGRYHSHYQNLKKTYDFMALCKDPRLAAEVAWGPIEDFDFDVSILFSDLLFPLEALGMGLSYAPGPQLSWRLNSLDELKRFQDPVKALEGVVFQKEALIETRKKLPADKSLIGFVGAPWTLFAYAVEGSHQGGLLEAKKRLSTLYRPFCEFMLPFLKGNIELQLEGGAELLVLFDTAAGDCDPLLYQKYHVPVLLELAKSFPGKLMYYAKGINEAHLKTGLLSEAPWAGCALDHRWNLAEQFISFPGKAMQGNFDQALLHLNPSDFKDAFKRYLEPLARLSPDQRKGWICGLGHGVLPKTPEENVRSFVQIVREFFPE